MSAVTTKSDQYPLISVVVRVYNRTRYLPLALKSVVNQTYPFVECIIIDDASSQQISFKIERIIKRFGQNNFYYYRNKTRQGYLGSLLEGALQAKGKYVVYLDDDDILPYDCVMTNFKELISENPAPVIVSGKSLYINYANSFIRHKIIPSRVVGKYNSFTFRQEFFEKSLVSGISGYCVVRQAIINSQKSNEANDKRKNIYSPDTAFTLAADTAFILELLDKTQSYIKYHPRITNFYRMHLLSYTSYLKCYTDLYSSHKEFFKGKFTLSLWQKLYKSFGHIFHQTLIVLRKGFNPIEFRYFINHTIFLIKYLF